MGSPYVSQSASGYSSAPPPDDGSVTAANKIKYATLKTQLSDPLKTEIDAINSQCRTALNVTPTSQSSAYTTTTADHLRPIEVTGTTTISLGDAATMVAQSMGYEVPIINTGSATVTIALITAANTLNGQANGTIALGPRQSARCAVNSTSNGYDVIASGNDIPAGVVMDFAGSSAPAGWLLCDGSAVSRTTYANLFTAISTTWGTGDGSTTFNVPDLRGRVTAGKDNMGGSAANRITSGNSGITGTTLGAAGGDERLHQHNHAISDSGHSHTPGAAGSFLLDTGGSAVMSVNAGAHSYPATGTTNTQTTGITINNAGSGASQNVQPTAIVLKIIKF